MKAEAHNAAGSFPAAAQDVRSPLPTAGRLVKGLTVLLGLAGIAAAEPAVADEKPIDLAGELTVDAVSAVAGQGDRRVRAVTNLNLTSDLDGAALIGWRGMHAHVHVLDNRGARPNDSVATLQGVDNIEVPRAGLRLFEAWIEQDLGRGASLRAGLYDVNSEFYANDSAGLLLGPSFGIGSELAATGPNGPSIFPSSALAARLYVPLGQKSGYVRAGVINARASTLGDDQGVDFSFRDGVLLIVETGVGEGKVRGSIGGWGYSHNPENIYETEADGSPRHKASYGAYAVLEADLRKGEGRQLTGFLRVGFSDPHTTPYLGGFQTGFLLAPLFDGRDASQASLGISHAWTNNHFRAAIRSDGRRPANETAVELTMSDELIHGLTVQPDLQWIHHPGGELGTADAVVGVLRMRWSF